MKKLFLLLCIICISSVTWALPGTRQYQAVWNANTESDLAGYFLYYKPISGEFNDADRIDCGLATSSIISGVVPTGSQIALTAYDIAGNESGLSDIVFFDLDSLAPGVPAGLRIEQVE